MSSPQQPIPDRSARSTAPVSAMRSARRRLVPLLPGALALAGWWKLRDELYHTHWREGPSVFLLLVASIALQVAVPWSARIARRLARGADAMADPAPDAANRAQRRWGSALLAASLFAAAAWSLRDEAHHLRANLAQDGVQLLDIGGNTWAAAVRFTDLGQNPYTHRTQLHRVTGAPGVTETERGVEMFGVPYFYGYPYFPAMFLSYAPFRLLDPGQHSIRIGNAWWLALLLAGGGWLAYRLAPAGRRAPAAALATLLLAATSGLARQLFFFGITDVVIAVYALFALVALSYRRHLLAGALLGLAVSAKILPALLVAGGVFVWLARRGGLRAALGGFVLVSSIVLLPFVAWHPGGFLSATILFYLTHHAGGDDTSLWFYLPEMLRAPFVAVGALAILAVTASVWRSRGDDQRDLLRTVVIASTLFLAFNKMIHLNYQFAVVPLACVALAADAMGPPAAPAPGRRLRRETEAP